jgi:hypothetical protein
MFPLNDPPVTVCRLAVAEPPCTTEIVFDPALNVRVGSGVTVNV